MNIAFICTMGIATVFIGLVCLIAITKIMSMVCTNFTKKGSDTAEAAPAKSDAPIANKSEIIAGVCAVIAEELDTDVSNIRVTSFKRL